MDETTYQSPFRRSELALPGLLIVLVLGGLGLYALLASGESSDVSMNAVLGLFGLVLAGIALVSFASFRFHRWQLEPGGIRIEEGPRIPFTGLRRRDFLAFSDIRGMKRIESGFDHRIEIVTRTGQRFALAQRHGPAHNGRAQPDYESLAAFATLIYSTAARAGYAIPAPKDVLGFWNRPAGLAFLLVLLFLSLAAAFGTFWAMFVEGQAPGSRNTQQAAAIVMILPLGVAYLLWRSFKRRRAVLEQRN